MSQQKFTPLSLKMVNIKLRDIWVDKSLSSYKIQEKIRYISNCTPSLSAAGLYYLELTQPIILVEHKQDNTRYRMIAGFRTYQLLCEQRDRSSTCLAIIANNIPEEDMEMLSAFDSIVPKVIQIPNDDGKAIIGHELATNKDLHSRVRKFMQVDGKVEVARLLGIKRTTLYKFEKIIDEYKGVSNSGALNSSSSSIKTSLDDEEWKD